MLAYRGTQKGDLSRTIEFYVLADPQIVSNLAQE